MSHVPVLLNASIDGLNLKHDGVYVDVTFGGGGHTQEILNRLGVKGKVIAFDQDEAANDRIKTDERLIFVNENFRHLKRFLRFHGFNQVDGILADLGMSSFQLDSQTRGFASRFDAPLDMRMSQTANFTAAHVVNTYSAQQLQTVFQLYGEIRNSKTLAQCIVEFRKGGEITTTGQLKEGIDRMVKGNKARYHAQLFQALRIEVNDEMGALKELLQQSVEVLSPGGRLSVISFHSLEDRLVKHFMKTGTFDGKVEKDLYGRFETPFDLISRKPIIPSEQEMKENPRSRSAKLRVAEQKSGES